MNACFTAAIPVTSAGVPERQSAPGAPDAVASRCRDQVVIARAKRMMAPGTPMTNLMSHIRITAVILATGLGWQLRAPAVANAAPPVVRLGDTQLDATALYFVSFDGLVNNASYQQNAIVSHAGFQYAAWYTASRAAVIARRRLPSGAWETLVLPHSLSTNDSHNSISLGISPADGRLHVAMDTHDSVVFYVKSEAGLVSSP